MFERSPANDFHPWRIAAAGIAGAAFALGWGSGYLGRSPADAPVVAPGSMMRPNDATAAPSSGKDSTEGPTVGKAADEMPIAAEVPAEAPVADQAVNPPVPTEAPEVHAALPPTATVLKVDAAPAPEAPASDAPAEMAASGFREIVVPRGTSLATLAQHYYGTGGPKLIERIRALNPQIVNVNQIFAGDRLRLPEITEPGRAHE